MHLKTPMNLVDNSVIEPKELDRHKVDYVDTSQRFYSVSKDFSKQYAHIYASRLQTFRNILTDRIKKKWSNKYPVLKLCDLLDKDKHTVIVGTIYVHQNLKPSILKEISDKLEIIPQPTRTHFVHEDDTLILEDELQRIRLSGEVIKVHRVVTGVVCAVLGFEEEDGVFKVLDVCWPDCAIQKPLPNLDNDRYVVIMSGLNLASQSEQNFFSYTLLLEWLCGLCGSNEYQEEVSKIVRVIVAGGVFSCNEGLVTDIKESDVIEGMSAVDNFCSVVSASAPLDLMPGCKDPAGVMLPQRPFHYCMFPKAAPYKSFNRVTNPYECDIGGFKFVGTSGEPVKNILQYSELQNSMEGMLATLQWRHLAPTAPDTVPSAPCIDTDPFTMYSCPAVHFMGNADQFSTQMYQGPEEQRVRVVCVPDFCVDRTVAVVNLRTLHCYPMTFN